MVCSSSVTWSCTRLHTPCDPDFNGEESKVVARSKIRNVAQFLRASSCVTGLDGVVVGGAAPFIECRIF
jgi:hypothetical protein